MLKRIIICISAQLGICYGHAQEQASATNVAFSQNQVAKTSLFQKLFKKKDTAGIEAAQPASAPFAFGDFSWLNGTSRKTSPPLIDSKYFTSDITFDLNYSHSYNNPIDNTVVGSTALARNNELQLSFLGFGGDIHVNNVRGRVMMQFGTRST